ncbi:hypothetical protein SEA_PUREGLOBE5_17 [Arthrobacter phage Pureglobe5]|nr:hypothetical protein SEA_PUREGLOBE5_17 [Arthrobacter phage Pureglobe5]
MDADKANDFIAKTFREKPADRIDLNPTPVPMPTWPPSPPPPKPAEVVGRIHSAALMGPTNLKAPVVLELWSNGVVTWRDG